MGKQIVLGAMYKVKENKIIDETEEILTKYVITLDFFKNPLIKNYDQSWFVSFMYIYKDTLEATTQIFPLRILPYDEFLNNFDLHMGIKEVNKKIKY